MLCKFGPYSRTTFSPALSLPHRESKKTQTSFSTINTPKLLAQLEGNLMAGTSTEYQVGDRDCYREGTQSWAARKRQVGTITAIFADGISGPGRADIFFDDGIEGALTWRC